MHRIKKKIRLSGRRNCLLVLKQKTNKELYQTKYIRLHLLQLVTVFITIIITNKQNYCVFV